MYSIITTIFYVKANIYKPDLFSYYSSNLVCMLQGVSKFYINLVIRHPLACSQYFLFLCIRCFYHAIYSMFKIICQKLFATCVFSIGGGVYWQNKTTEKWENTASKMQENSKLHQWTLETQKNFVIKMVILPVEKLKFVVVFQIVSLKIAPKIYFRKVVLENQVCRGLKKSLKMYKKINLKKHQKCSKMELFFDSKTDFPISELATWGPYV